MVTKSNKTIGTNVKKYDAQPYSVLSFCLTLFCSLPCPDLLLSLALEWVVGGTIFQTLNYFSFSTVLSVFSFVILLFGLIDLLGVG